MATPYDSAIVALQEEISALTSAMRLLERRRDDHATREHVVFSDFVSATVNNGSGPTNERAVDKILTEAFPSALGVTEIVKRGDSVGGRTLNKNSVRWVLKHGVDDERYNKRKEAGRAWYSMNK